METLEGLCREGILGSTFFKVTASDGRQWLEDAEGNEVIMAEDDTRYCEKCSSSLMESETGICRWCEQKIAKPKGAFESLMADIEKTIATAEGDWSIRWDGSLIVTTIESQDPSRSNNGGEYDHYRIYKTSGLGIEAYDTWSCDFAEYQYSDDQSYDCIVGSDGLGRMAQLAEVTTAARAWLAKEPGCMQRLKKAIRALGE